MNKFTKIALCLGLMATNIVPCFAEEGIMPAITDEPQPQVDPNQQEAHPGVTQVDVIAHIPSTYSVMIPKTINVSNTTQLFSVKVKGDISSDEVIKVVPNPKVTLDDKSGWSTHKESRTGNVELDKQSWNFNEICDSNYYTIDGLVQVNGLTAGNWGGKLAFTISCENIDPSLNRDRV